MTTFCRCGHSRAWHAPERVVAATFLIADDFCVIACQLCSCGDYGPVPFATSFRASRKDRKEQ